jgi:quinol monooxygenase YgiN
VIIALGDIYAQIPRREEVRDLMRATQERVRSEPGCISYEFAETLDAAGHFIVVEQWTDLAALQQHYRSPAFAFYQAQINDQLLRTSELSVHVVSESSKPVESSPRAAQDED